jgi:ABC-type branched-subunit amino acid transport system substrate-binding protein
VSKAGKVIAVAVLAARRWRLRCAGDGPLPTASGVCPTRASGKCRLSSKKATGFLAGWGVCAGHRALDRLLRRAYTPAVKLSRLVLIGTLALGLLVAPLVADAQPPIRIGASLSQTGVYATQGQNLLRGYQLCVKHTNGKGGVLGRQLELVVYDDVSDPATAVRLYEKLITQDKVDLVLGPWISTITDPVADATSIYTKGRKFIFSMLSPAEITLEGLIDQAAKKGLKTLLNTDDLGQRSVTQRASELAKEKGLQAVFTDAYPLGTTDFSAILTRVRAANPRRAGRRHKRF